MLASQINNLVSGQKRAGPTFPHETALVPGATQIQEIHSKLGMTSYIKSNLFQRN